MKVLLPGQLDEELGYRTTEVPWKIWENSCAQERGTTLASTQQKKDGYIV